MPAGEARRNIQAPPGGGVAGERVGRRALGPESERTHARNRRDELRLLLLAAFEGSEHGPNI
jgi:hypothetical protein